MRKIVALFAFMLCLCATAQQDVDTMYICCNDYVIERIAVSKIDSVTFVAPVVHTVSVSEETGGVCSISGIDKASATIITGKEIAVVAIPNAGYEFIGWFVGDSDTTVSTEATYVFSVLEDIELVAKFKKLMVFRMVFRFEYYETTSYTSWFEINNDSIRSDIWSSGNAGFKLVASKKPAEEYPTTTCAEGLNGDCVKLTTCDTGTMGKLSKMPIAAGSIFIGEFDTSNAMKAPLEATRMGMQILPANAKPAKLTGYYKYTPGEVFTDKNKKEIEDRRDTCAIYAVVFEVDPADFEPLNGANVTTSDRIVLLAELKTPGEPAEWEKFEIPFEPMNGKEFDYEKLANNEYAITIVASSSKDGAFFEGAIGSALLVDELELEFE